MYTIQITGFEQLRRNPEISLGLGEMVGHIVKKILYPVAKKETPKGRRTVADVRRRVAP